MNIPAQPVEQLRRVYPSMVVVWTFSLLVIGFIAVLHRWGGVGVGYLTKDPASTMGAHFFVGFLSQLGMVLWSAAAALCFFAAFMVRSTGVPGRPRAFLLCSGLLTAVLLFDDLFLIHEEVAPEYLGVAELYVFALYGILMLAFLTGFARTILSTDFLLLANALGAFALSVAVDVTFPSTPLSLLAEDGAKFIGITSWLAYFAHVSAAALRPLQEGGMAEPRNRESLLVKRY